ncbi:hypothetical protein [Planktotalea sp.]|uniref:hypothetical protein n=1 Tax=Planktotalea sp. TaxID=2029877 RepID=UPI003D6A7F9C
MIRPPLTHALIALCIAGGLTACDITSARTLWALRNVDPLTTAPEGIRLAVRVPQGFRPSPKGITLIGTLKETASAPEESVTFAIQRSEGGALPAWMQRPGAPLYSYKISESDLDRFRKYQHKAALAKASNRDGSISVGTEVCRLSDEIPDSVLVSVFIKTVETEQFVPLFEDQDLTEHATEEEIAETVPLCL